MPSEDGLAFGGYDPVGLRKTGKPQPGSEAHVHEWNGATWRFASEDNRQAFVSDPEAFAPEFGGHCSFAMSLGKTVPGNPNTWSIVDDRLYVNSNPVAKILWKLLPGRIDAGRKQWETTVRGA